jgi:hypothetical protein
MEQGEMGLSNFHQTLFCQLLQAFCLVLMIALGLHPDNSAELTLRERNKFIALLSE